VALASSSGAVASVIGLTGAGASDVGHIAKVTYGWRSHCHWRWGHWHCSWRGYPHWGHYRPWGHHHHWSQQHWWGPRHSWRS
jgi:hypothetical protein